MSYFRFAIVVVIALSALSSRSGEAQETRFKGAGSDAQYFPFGDDDHAPGDYEGSGNATHLGKNSFLGNITPVGEFFPAEGIFFAGTFSGSQTHVAANGDTVDFELVEGIVVLEFNEEGLAFGSWSAVGIVTGGTGRFADASGVVEVVATNPPFNPFVLVAWPFDWTFDGKIDLGKKK